MKYFAPILAVSAIALASMGLGYYYCKDKASVTKTDNGTVTLAKTPVTSKGMVVAANPYATQAGVEILQAGGSALDAAIAVQTTLGLVEPQSSGLGGGAFLVTYDSKTGEVWSYDGRETAPADVTDQLFYDDEGKPLRYFDGIASGRSTGVPGAMVMLHRAHQDYGTLDWGAGGQFDFAHNLATDGFNVPGRMASTAARMGRFVLKNSEAAKNYFFLEDGSTIKEGQQLTNKDYAEVLDALKANPRAMIEGPIAEAIIEEVRREPYPGTLTLADMAAYQPEKNPALCTTYRAHMICGAQPPASGGVAVQSILRTLENFDMAAKGPTADGWHHFIEASFLGYADRSQYVADPKFVDVPVTQMLNETYLKSRAALIKPNAALGTYNAGERGDFTNGQDATPDSPGTSHFTIIDKDGLVVSMTTTVEAPLGSQRMVKGFMLNNQLTDFSFKSVDDEGNPIANAAAAGKRPRSSMSPTIVFNPEGEFLFSSGSPGGNSIIAYTAKTIVGMIDWGLTPQEATDLPNVIARPRNGVGRVRMEAKGLIDEETNEIIRTGPAAEFGMSPEIVAELEAMGHNISKSRGEISGVHIIYRHPDGSLSGAADARREGNVGVVK
ncbi:MAG: gamma-glutamyltransferase family protein [Maricaulaceae bacterium]